MDEELIALTPSNHDELARMLQAWRSGALLPKLPQEWDVQQRIFEAVPFINASGEEIPAYAVMRITTPTTVDSEKVVNVAKPDGTYRWRYLVNGPDTVDAASGSRGWGTWVWDSDRVLYDTGSTPAFGEEWGPKSGEWKLFQHRPGFILDGRYDATDGVVWAQQMPPGEILVKNSTGSAIAAAASGTATLYGGTAGSEATLGLTVTAYNRSSTSWADGKYGMADLINGQVYVSPQQT